MTKFYLNNKRCLYNKVKSYLDFKGVTKKVLREENYTRIKVFTDRNGKPWIILDKPWKIIHKKTKKN